MFNSLKKMFSGGVKSSKGQKSVVSTSKSGVSTYQYGQPKDFEFAIGDGDLIEAVEQHVKKHVGDFEMVLHELISDKVHIDILPVPPTEDNPFWTVVTCGMSDKKINVPEGFEKYERLELFITLPADWSMTEESWKNEDSYWPIHILKIFARMPHDYDTFFLPGHTLQLTHDDSPIGQTNFADAILMPTALFDAGFKTMEFGKETVSFLSLVPLFKEEKDYKLEHGIDAFIDLVQKADGAGIHLEPTNMDRPSLLTIL